ncbi:MAG: hypothetical protein SOW59_04030 [Corynebacterium sp.]|nr:hypothetical protein [Corynebacterium sp.]
MTAPLIEFLSKEDASRELDKLKNSIEGRFEDFEERAYSYNLTPREFALWERISELRWLLGDG